MKTFFISLGLLIGASAMAQTWDFCQDVEISHDYVVNASSSELDIDITFLNQSSETTDFYCTINTTTADLLTAELIADDNCFQGLAPGASFTYTATFEFVNNISSYSGTFDYFVGLKENVTENPETCDYNMRITAVNGVFTVEELILSNPELSIAEGEYKSEYFDLMGRSLETAPLQGFFIERKSYSNGEVKVEKHFMR